jgi:VWFA-related protein
MNIFHRIAVVSCAALSWVSLPLVAQVTSPAPTTAAADQDHQIVLDMVVTDHSGQRIRGLVENDFTVLDNNQPQKLLAFRETAAAQPAGPIANSPTSILILVDEVNTNYSNVAYERDQIKKFLLQNGGELPYPVSFGFFSDTGTELMQGYSRDGKVLLDTYNQHVTGLRSVRRSTGFYGAVERLQLSINTLASLTASEAKLPGRKMVIWISPGWPLLESPHVDTSSVDRQKLFASIVSFSTELRKARVTLYSIDPLGLADAGGVRTTYYEEFLKPVSVVKNAQNGNLALEVLATQTGGLVMHSNNDITQSITHCIDDAGFFYTVALAAAPAEHPNEFHLITVKVDKPGLTVRTRNGYYAQP